MADAPNLWDFVHCAICFTFWSDPPSVPFWATGCGHILCNDHLRGDGACAACGSSNVEVVVLKNEPSEPMSRWFQPISQLQQSAVMASRFQVDMLTSLVRHYQQETSKQRSSLDKLRRIAESAMMLREEVRRLQDENATLKNGSFNEVASTSGGSDERYGLNQNGKRQRLEGMRPASTLSYRSIPTSVQPSRLTLPSDRHAPSLGGSESLYEAHEENSYSGPAPVQDLKQFAYQPQARERPSEPRRVVQQVSGTNSRRLPEYDTAGNERSMPPPQHPAQSHTSAGRSKNQLPQMSVPSRSHPGLSQTPSRRNYAEGPIAPTPSRPYTTDITHMENATLSSDYQQQQQLHASRSHQSSTSTARHRDAPTSHMTLPGPPSTPRHEQSTFDSRRSFQPPLVSSRAQPSVGVVSTPRQFVPPTVPGRSSVRPTPSGAHGTAHAHAQSSRSMARPSTAQPLNSMAHVSSSGPEKYRPPTVDGGRVGGGTGGAQFLVPASNTTQARFRPVTSTGKVGHRSGSGGNGGNGGAAAAGGSGSGARRFAVPFPPSHGVGR